MCEQGSTRAAVAMSCICSALCIIMFSSCWNFSFWLVLLWLLCLFFVTLPVDQLTVLMAAQLCNCELFYECVRVMSRWLYILSLCSCVYCFKMIINVVVLFLICFLLPCSYNNFALFHVIVLLLWICFWLSVSVFLVSQVQLVSSFFICCSFSLCCYAYCLLWFIVRQMSLAVVCVCMQLAIDLFDLCFSVTCLLIAVVICCT